MTVRRLVPPRRTRARRRRRHVAEGDHVLAPALHCAGRVRRREGPTDRASGQRSSDRRWCSRARPCGAHSSPLGGDHEREWVGPRRNTRYGGFPSSTDGPRALEDQASRASCLHLGRMRPTPDRQGGYRSVHACSPISRSAASSRSRAEVHPAPNRVLRRCANPPEVSASSSGSAPRAGAAPTRDRIKKATPRPVASQRLPQPAKSLDRSRRELRGEPTGINRNVTWNVLGTGTAHTTRRRRIAE